MIATAPARRLTTTEALRARVADLIASGARVTVVEKAQRTLEAAEQREAVVAARRAQGRLEIAAKQEREASKARHTALVAAMDLAEAEVREVEGGRMSFTYSGITVTAWPDRVADHVIRQTVVASFGEVVRLCRTHLTDDVIPAARLHAAG
jgi:hypothetical protein